MDWSPPKFSECCHPLTCPRTPNLVQIGCVLPDLFRKDWFFGPKVNTIIGCQPTNSTLLTLQSNDGQERRKLSWDISRPEFSWLTLELVSLRCVIWKFVRVDCRVSHSVTSQWKLRYPKFISFDALPTTVWQTDRQTNTLPVPMSCRSIAEHNIN